MSNSITNIEHIPITTIDLNSSQFGADLGSRLEAIDANFENIIKSEFLKGVKGDSIITREIKLSQNTSIYNAIRAALIGDLNIGVGPVRNNTIHWDNDLINKSILMQYIVKDGEEIPVFCVPFVYIDSRFADINAKDEHDFDAEISEYIDLIDLSGTIYYQYNPETNTGSYVKENNFPTIYYDTEVNRFCWNLYGQKSNIIASGPAGKDGKNGKMFLVKYNSSTGVVTSYIKYEAVDGEWTSKWSSKQADLDTLYDSIKNFDIVIGFPHQSDHTSYIISPVIKHVDNNGGKTVELLITTSGKIVTNMAISNLLSQAMLSIGNGVGPDGLFIPIRSNSGSMMKLSIAPVVNQDANGSKKRIHIIKDGDVEGVVGPSELNVKYQNINLGSTAKFNRSIDKDIRYYDLKINDILGPVKVEGVEEPISDNIEGDDGTKFVYVGLDKKNQIDYHVFYNGGHHYVYFKVFYDSQIDEIDKLRELIKLSSVNKDNDGNIIPHTNYVIPDYSEIRTYKTDPLNPEDLVQVTQPTNQSVYKFCQSTKQTVHSNDLLNTGIRNSIIESSKISDAHITKTQLEDTAIRNVSITDSNIFNTSISNADISETKIDNCDVNEIHTKKIESIESDSVNSRISGLQTTNIHFNSVVRSRPLGVLIKRLGDNQNGSKINVYQEELGLSEALKNQTYISSGASYTHHRGPFTRELTVFEKTFSKGSGLYDSNSKIKPFGYLYVGGYTYIDTDKGQARPPYVDLRLHATITIKRNGTTYTYNPQINYGPGSLWAVNGGSYYIVNCIDLTGLEILPGDEVKITAWAYFYASSGKNDRRCIYNIHLGRICHSMTKPLRYTTSSGEFANNNKGIKWLCAAGFGLSDGSTCLYSEKRDNPKDFKKIKTTAPTTLSFCIGTDGIYIGDSSAGYAIFHDGSQWKADKVLATQFTNGIKDEDIEPCTEDETCLDQMWNRDYDPDKIGSCIDIASCNDCSTEIVICDFDCNPDDCEDWEWDIDDPCEDWDGDDNPDDIDDCIDTDGDNIEDWEDDCDDMDGNGNDDWDDWLCPNDSML